MTARRLLLATAITRYPLAPNLDMDREELAEDVERMRALLCDCFGYEHVPILSADPTGEQLRYALTDFADDPDRRDDDYVLLYLAGHGAVLNSGKHVLLPSDYKPPNAASRGVKTADLAGWMLEEHRIRRLMIILDCCYAGQGGKELAAEALSNWNGEGSLVVITATRPHQQAQPGVFTQAFERAVRNVDRAAGGFAAPALSVRSIVDRIRHDVQLPGFQTPVPVQFGAGPDLDFLPNPHYTPWLVDLDVETQERLYQQQHEQLETRFLPATQWFTGRHRVLQELTGWLACDTDRHLQVVTGDPGSGKTAVLGLLAALSDPDRRPGVPRRGLPEQLPPARSIDVALYAGTMTTPQVLTAIGAAAAVRVDPSMDGSEQLKRLATAISSRFRDGNPLTVLIDAVDEAAEPQELTRRLDHLLRLLEQVGGGLRMLLGTRRPLLEHLRTPVDVIDLDDSTYADPNSVRAYARTVLLQSRTDSPYRKATSETVLQAVAEAIAIAASRSFLVARILAQSLAAAAEPADPTDEIWQRTLPRTAGDAMSLDLNNRLADRADRARELLLPLAYAEGPGLPREDGIWARLANALHPGRHTDEADLTWLRRHAGSYFKEANGSLYRLFHHSLVEYLLQGRDAVADHAAIGRALTDCVPPAAQRRLDWSSAHSYIRTHLATHAAQGRTLDTLLTDPDYLLTAVQAPLVAALRYANSAAAKATAYAYHRAARDLSHKPGAQHASYMELAARCSGAPHLADVIAARYPHRSWSTRWASQLDHPHLSFLIHAGWVSAVAVAELDGRPVVVSGGFDRCVRVWDLATGTLIGRPFTGHRGPVRAVAVAELDGRPVVVSAGGEVWVWDLATRAPFGEPFTGHGDTGKAVAVAVAELDGRPVGVSAGGNEVWVWDLASRAPIGEPITGHAGWIRSVAVAELDGRPVGVSAGGNEVWVWDLASRAPIGEPFTGHAGWVRAVVVAIAELDGRPVGVSGDDDGTMWVWDLASRAPIGEPFTGHDVCVRAVAVAELEGRPVVVSAGDADYVDDGTYAHDLAQVWVWDLASRNPIGEPFRGRTEEVHSVAVADLNGRQVIVSGTREGRARVCDLALIREPFTGHRGPVRAVAVAELDGRPVVVSAGDDGAVRVWDLAKGSLIREPFTGHRGRVRAVAVAELDGRPVVVSAGDDGAVRVWDLASRAPIGQPFTGHRGQVRALAVAELDGRPVVVSAGDGRTVRVWDLTTRRALVRLETPGNTHGFQRVNAVDIFPFQAPRFVQAMGFRWDLVHNAPVRGRWRWEKPPKFRRVQQELRQQYNEWAVGALVYQSDRDRAIVARGTTIEIEEAQDSQLIELHSTVLALAAAAPQTIIAATWRGIIVLDVP